MAVPPRLHLPATVNWPRPVLLPKVGPKRILRKAAAIPAVTAKAKSPATRQERLVQVKNQGLLEALTCLALAAVAQPLRRGHDACWQMACPEGPLEWTARPTMATLVS